MVAAFVISGVAAAVRLAVEGRWLLGIAGAFYALALGISFLSWLNPRTTHPARWLWLGLVAMPYLAFHAVR